MKIQHLKFFAAVVRHGGVIKAAEHLHLSQPAVSAGLKSLEEALGGKLFDRSRGNRRIRLTSKGHQFHLRTLAILKECDVARAEFLGEEPPRRRLRLGVLETLPHALIAATLARLHASQPEQAVEVWEGAGDRLLAWLGQERIDVALTIVAEQSANVLVLWREPYVAVVAPTHPLAKSPRRAITMRAFTDQPYVYRLRCEAHKIGEARLRAAGATPRLVIKAERDELAFDAVAIGAGMTLAPRSSVPAHLVPLTVAGLGLARTIGVQWRAGVDRNVAEAVHRAALQAGKGWGRGDKKRPVPMRATSKPRRSRHA